MDHLPVLIQDLGLILAAGAVFTLIFKKLNQPVVLGYLIAGILVSPHFNYFPTVKDHESIETWAEIGVIFLLFGLGLEFSFRKLMSVGAPASLSAISECIFMSIAGYTAGVLMGWNTMDSIFLGAILSVSSTTIVIRAFEEIGAKSKKYAAIVFGILIVEDLISILLLVLLTTVSVSQQLHGSELIQSILKLAFFLIIWFVVGIFIFPTLLSKIKKLMNNESFLILSIALCLLTVLLATYSGFSAALGAFIMGSALAETREAEKIERIFAPVKDLFAAVFFVSVGMMVDLDILATYFIPIVILTVITIVGKFLSTSFGTLISGQPLKTGLQTGLSLAQIGEFSFIIAALGASLKVTSDFIYPITVAISVVTAFTTPYMIKIATPMATWMEGKMPESWKDHLANYGATIQKISSFDQGRSLVKNVLTKMMLHALVIIAIFLIGFTFLNPWVSRQVEQEWLAHTISLTVTLFLAGPFLWAMAFGRQEFQMNPADRPSHFKVFFIVLEAIRVSVAISLILGLVFQFYQEWWAVAIPLVLMAGTIWFFSSRFEVIYKKIESRFLTNLNEKNRVEEKEAAKKKLPALAPWDAHITKLEIHPESDVVGKTLFDLKIREKFGVTIALIERGNKNITAPTRYMTLYPFDQISVIGTDEQLDALKAFLVPTHPVSDEENERHDSRFKLEQILLSKTSPLLGKTIRESGIREATDGLVVGIEREGRRLLNPDSTLKLLLGDLIWIVGDREKIRQLK